MIIMTTDEPVNYETFEVKEEQDHGAVHYGSSNNRHERGYMLKETRNTSQNEYNTMYTKSQKMAGKSSAQINQIQSRTYPFWIKTEHDSENWTLIEDAPFAKRLCLRRGRDHPLEEVPCSDIYHAQQCSGVYVKKDVEHKLPRSDRPRHTLTNIDQESNDFHNGRSYSPTEIHINVDQEKQQVGVTNRFSTEKDKQKFQRYSKHDSLRPASIPPLKRHSDGIVIRRGTANDFRQLNRSCSDTTNLQKDERDTYELNTLQKNLVEALYKTCYDLSKRGTQHPDLHSDNHTIPQVSRVQSPEQETLGAEVKAASKPTLKQFSSETESSNQSGNTYGQHKKNLGVFTEDGNHHHNNQPYTSPVTFDVQKTQLSPTIRSIKSSTALPQSYRVVPSIPVKRMPCSPDQIKPKIISPKKVSAVSSSCHSPNASPTDDKTEFPNTCPQRKCEAESSGTPLTIEEELVNLQTRYRQSCQPNLQWAEKEFSVKELRHLIPVLILEIFDLKSDPVTKKVKGIWDKAPVGWPSSVPYIDPNNGQKPTGKPKKGVLLKMFTYLLHQYIHKVAEEGLDASPYNSTGQSNATPVTSLDLIPRSSSINDSSLSSPSSEGSYSSYAPTYEGPIQCSKNLAEVQHPEGLIVVCPSPDIQTMDVAPEHSQNRPSPIELNEINSEPHSEILQQMPALIPISEILQNPRRKKQNITFGPDSEEDRQVGCITHGSATYSNSVDEHNDHMQDINLVTSTVQSPVARALTFEKPITQANCDPNITESRYPSHESMYTENEGSSVNGDIRQESPKTTEQEIKSSCTSPTSPFRGMKARILGACQNRNQVPKARCDTTSNRTSEDVNGITEEKQRSFHEECTEQTYNKASTNVNETENNLIGTLTPSSKHVLVGDRKKNPSTDDVTTNCAPDAGHFRPVLALYSRIKEKVYYIHWTGWLCDGHVRLLYNVLDQLNAMKQVTAECEKKEERYIESAHLFESVLDLVMLRKTIKNGHIAILMQLKKHIYGSIGFVNV